MLLPLGPVKDSDYPILCDEFTFEEVEYEKCEAFPFKTICDALVSKVEHTDSKYLCICVPCYNEDVDEFLKTILSLMENMEFIHRKAFFDKNEEGEKLEKEFSNIIPIIIPIFDGITAMSESMKNWLKDNFPNLLNSFDDTTEVKAMSRRWWYYGDDSDLEINPEVTGQSNHKNIREKIDSNTNQRTDNSTHRVSILRIQTRPKIHIPQVEKDLTASFMGSARGSQSLNLFKNVIDHCNDDNYDDDDEDNYEIKKYFNESVITEEFTKKALMNNYDEDYLLFFHMVVIVKKRNYRKHNSHQWFFNGVCSG